MRDAMGIGGERKRREKDTPTFGQTRSPNDTYFARRVVDPGYDAGCPLLLGTYGRDGSGGPM
jgi:hypothetical protein